MTDNMGYRVYIVTLKDPETLRTHDVSYHVSSDEDSNDVWGYALEDHPDYDVVGVLG